MKINKYVEELKAKSAAELNAHYFTCTGFSQISFHDNSPSAILCIRLLCDNSLDSGDVLANLFDSACVLQLICRVLESQVRNPVGLNQIR